MSFISDYGTAYFIWRDLTKAQRRALAFPWNEPHPKVRAALTAKGLWDEHGPTRSGLAVALCRYLTGRAA